MSQRSQQPAADDHEVRDLRGARDAGRCQRRLLQREAARTAEALTLLRRGGLQALLAKGKRLSGLPACLALLRRSRELRDTENSRQAVEHARWAVFTAENLKPERYGAELVVDLQARALGVLGNACRLVGDFQSAEQALTSGSSLARRGSGDPFLRAFLLGLDASFRAECCRFAEARCLLEDAQRIYAACGERHLIGRVLLDLGAHAAWANNPECSMQLTQEALTLLDHEKDPPLALTAVHNLAGCLAETGCIPEAREVLQKNQARYRLHAPRVLLVTRAWLEGNIFADLGELGAAEELLTEARRGFHHAGRLPCVGLVSLDLAAVWLRQGRSRAARDLAKQAAELFVSVGWVRETLAAIATLRDASRMQAAKARLWQYLLDQL